MPILIGQISFEYAVWLLVGVKPSDLQPTRRPVDVIPAPHPLNKAERQIKENRTSAFHLLVKAIFEGEIKHSPNFIQLENPGFIGKLLPDKIDEKDFFSWVKDNWDILVAIRAFPEDLYEDTLPFLAKVKKTGGLKIARPNLSVSHKARVVGRHAKTHRHKEAAISKAKEMWNKNGALTIADIVNSNEMNEAVEKETYTEKTVRGWINAFAPNRKPGRRKKLIAKK